MSDGIDVEATGYNIFKTVVAVGLLIALLVVYFLFGRNVGGGAAADAGGAGDAQESEDLQTLLGFTAEFDVQGNSVEIYGTSDPVTEVELFVDSEFVERVPVEENGTWSITTEVDNGTHEFGLSVLYDGDRILETRRELPISGPGLTPEGGDADTQTDSASEDGGDDNTGTDDDTIDAAGQAGAGNDDAAAGTEDDNGASAEDGASDTDDDGDDAGTGDATPTVTLRAAPAEPGTLTLQGDAPPGANIAILAGDTPLGTVDADDNTGRWDFSTELPSGDYNVIAEASDADGASLGSSAPLAVTVEPPSPTVVFPPNPVAGIATQLTGTAEPGRTVVVLVDGEAAATATADASGNWSLPIDLAEGPRLVEVAIEGDAGPVSRSGERVVDVAPAPPVASGALTCVGDPGYREGNTWVVGPCDTMTSIARDLGVSFASFRLANPQVTNPDIIVPGQVLNIP